MERSTESAIRRKFAPGPAWLYAMGFDCDFAVQGEHLLVNIGTLDHTGPMGGQKLTRKVPLHVIGQICSIIEARSCDGDFAVFRHKESKEFNRTRLGCMIYEAIDAGRAAQALPMVPLEPRTEAFKVAFAKRDEAKTFALTHSFTHTEFLRLWDTCMATGSPKTATPSVHPEEPSTVTKAAVEEPKPSIPLTLEALQEKVLEFQRKCCEASVEAQGFRRAKLWAEAEGLRADAVEMAVALGINEDRRAEMFRTARSVLLSQPVKPSEPAAASQEEVSSQGKSPSPDRPDVEKAVNVMVSEAIRFAVMLGSMLQIAAMEMAEDGTKH